MEKYYITNNLSETKRLGGKLAKEILKSPVEENAFVIALKGDLGSGKTTFLQGFAKGLGIQEKILSPTFVILKKFEITKSRADFKNFYHIDCYRIQNSKEILDLGFKQIVSDPKNIIAIEWAERIEDVLPKNALILNFKFIAKAQRKITIN